MVIIADVNRRVFEEPWFGKPVADILFERQQGTVHGPGLDKPEDQEAARAGSEQITVHGQIAIHGAQEEQTTVHGKNEPQPEEQTTIHGNNEPQQEPQETIHGKNEPQQEQESAWEKMYGNMQAAEQERGPEQDAGK